MIHLDICCCTYNSSKWFEGFFNALSNVKYDLKHLHLYFTDNNSSDNTIDDLQAYKLSIGNTFGDFEIIQTGYNGGFSVGSNTSARSGKSPFVLFLNVDTEISADAFINLEKAINSYDSSVGVFEMRQIPYEHPKYYDPVTLETTWATGAAMVVRREVFEKLGGFDETIFMYCEDVDFSWRIRLAGYKIIYLPECTVKHYIDGSGEMKPTQIAGQLAGEKILRLKFGDDAELKKWPEIFRMFKPFLQDNEFAANLSEKLLNKVSEHEDNYRKFYKNNVVNSNFTPIFEGCFEFAKDGQSYYITKPKTVCDITVIINSISSQKLLTNTLKSLCNQTVHNFKVIVIASDDANERTDVINNFMSELDIDYISSITAKNISEIYNYALGKVETKYVVFLKEGDYFFSDYIELISKLIKDNSDCKMFCSSAVSAATKKLSSDGSEYEFIRKENISSNNLSKINFYIDNPLPIQAVTFDIALFNEYGGFDESLEAFEDWDLWIKYSTHCRIAFINKSLSLFRIPAERLEIIANKKHCDLHHETIYRKLSTYISEFSAQDIHSLKWSPDVPPVYEGEDINELKEIACQIRNSTVYKLASPFRKILYKISDTFARMASFWGPKDIAETSDDYNAIQNFVIKAQDSSYMNIISNLRNKLKK